MSEPRICRVCQGAGEVYEVYAHRAGCCYDRLVACPSCLGSGLTPPKSLAAKKEQVDAALEKAVAAILKEGKK